MRGRTVAFALSLLAVGAGGARVSSAQIDDTVSIMAASGPAAPAADRGSRVVFSIDGRVREVEDGDTVTLQAETGARFTIRFSDIDTPETFHDAFTPRDCKCQPVPARPGQPGGQRARASLLELVAVNDPVRAECYEADQYGRLVCHVFRGGVNLNLEQIKRGWGWLPDNTRWVRDPESGPAEQAARAARLGAWGIPNQVSPADWRHACWREGQCPGAER